LTIEIIEEKYLFEYERLSKIHCKLEKVLFNNSMDPCSCVDLEIPDYCENLSITDNDGKHYQTQYSSDFKRIIIYFRPSHQIFERYSHRTIVYNYTLSLLTEKAKDAQYPNRRGDRFNFQFGFGNIHKEIIIKGNPNFDLITCENIFEPRDENNIGIFLRPIPFCQKYPKLIKRVLTQDTLIYQMSPKINNCAATVDVAHIIRLSRLFWYIGGIIIGSIMCIVSFLKISYTNILPLQAGVLTLLVIIRGWLFTEHQNELPQNTLEKEQILLLNHNERRIGRITYFLCLKWVPYYNYLYLFLIVSLILIILINSFPKQLDPTLIIQQSNVFSYSNKFIFL
jgi:hypothetical protein